MTDRRPAYAALRRPWVLTAVVSVALGLFCMTMALFDDTFGTPAGSFVIGAVTGAMAVPLWRYLSKRRSN